MLDGPAPEMLVPHSGMKIQRSGGAFRMVEDGPAFKRQDGKTFFEKQSHHPPRKLDEGPNFSRLPAEVLEDGKQFTPNQSPSEAELNAFAQHLIEEASKGNSSVTTTPSMVHEQIDQTPVPTFHPPTQTISQPSTASETGISTSKNTNSEQIKITWEKVKGVAKKILYYASGGFIWDKIF